MGPRLYMDICVMYVLIYIFIYTYIYICIYIYIYLTGVPFSKSQGRKHQSPVGVAAQKVEFSCRWFRKLVLEAKGGVRTLVGVTFGRVFEVCLDLPDRAWMRKRKS